MKATCGPRSAPEARERTKEAPADGRDAQYDVLRRPSVGTPTASVPALKLALQAPTARREELLAS